MAEKKRQKAKDKGQLLVLGKGTSALREYVKAQGADLSPAGDTKAQLGTLVRILNCWSEGGNLHALLQSDGAMLDWIAVPHFLDAYK